MDKCCQVLMKYFLIKNCQIANRQENNLDILIANNKIIAIGKNLSCPTVNTSTFDAEKYLVVPGFVNICSPFISLSNTEEKRRLIHDDIAGGYTTWIGTETATNMMQTLSTLGKQDIHTLNYSFHFDVDHFKHGDLNKMKSLSVTYGLPSMLYSITGIETAQNDRIDLFVATAAQNNLLLIFSLIHNNSNADEILEALKIISKRIDNAKCRTLFANVRYAEEIDIISKLRNNNDIYAQICLDINAIAPSNITLIDGQMMISMLRENKWICADIISPDGSAQKRIAQSFEICQKCNIEESELVEYMNTRKCQITGLAPAKGEIRIGADADICIIKKGKIRAVIQNGKLTYDDGIMHENINGMQAFRRII